MFAILIMFSACVLTHADSSHVYEVFENARNQYEMLTGLDLSDREIKPYDDSEGRRMCYMLLRDEKYKELLESQPDEIFHAKEKAQCDYMVTIGDDIRRNFLTTLSYTDLTNAEWKAFFQAYPSKSRKEDILIKIPNKEDILITSEKEAGGGIGGYDKNFNVNIGYTDIQKSVLQKALSLYGIIDQYVQGMHNVFGLMYLLHKHSESINKILETKNCTTLMKKKKIHRTRIKRDRWEH